jgi:hypothetical protein
MVRLWKSAVIPPLHLLHEIHDSVLYKGRKDVGF